MKEILEAVKSYIDEKQDARTWTAGKDFVNYAGSYYNSDEFVAGVESLLKGWLVMGDDGIKFEREFPRQFGKTHGILTNSGSSSNLLMMSALTSKRGHNFPKGTKVLMPIAGFPTTVNPTIQLGLTPVFVDIELDTLNIDLDQTEALLQNDPDIKIITFAHVLGNPPNMHRVMELVDRL
jgi:CDP-4-dehydro-6-deoxyglucose reductase, E1